jgi:hypothetical protein
MRRALVVVFLVACSSSSSKNEINPDPSKADGGQSSPDPNPSKPGESKSGTRLKARTMVGADGSRSFVGWYDSQQKTDCNFTKSADGQTRCLPTSAFTLPSHFTDSGCTTPVGYAAKGCPPATKYLQSPRSASCNTTYAVHQLGALYTGDIFIGSPDSCTKTSPSSALDYYTVGAEVPASTFVAGSEEHE